MKKKLIVLTTGGSGGHVFPAEAFATAIQNKAYELAFITDKRIQNKIQGTLATLPVYYVAAEAVTGKGVFKKIIAAFKLLWGTVQSVYLLVKLKPALVIGFGGYASLPATLAAQFLNIPVMLHEQNAILGRANRLLARRTHLIATSFTPTTLIPEGIKTVQTGMPVRPAILGKVGTAYPTDTTEFRLLVMGGSQGAKIFASVIPAALNILSPDLKAKLVLHQQVRAENMEQVQEAYRNSGIKSITLSPFFTDVPTLLADAHLVISRSGSSSLAEFSALGKPALLIPLPTSADDHQTANARVFTANGSGWLMIEKDFTPEKLAARLTELMENPAILKRASDCALQTAQTNAAGALTDAVEKVIKKEKS